jgi:dihydroflavonol-4-reductase
MNALVTGATGFLGKHLCRRLVGDGHKVTILCRPTSNTDALADLELTKIVGDIIDSETVDRAVSGNDLVFHAAAHLAYWGQQKESQNKVNIEGTKNVVRSCFKFRVRKLVHVSSVAAVGMPENPEHPADENFSFNLDDRRLNYHISKKRAEESVLDAVKTGLNAVIVNPGSMWGPDGKKFRGAEFLQKVIRGKIASYFTGGICVVHVEDVVDGIMAAAARGRIGERYILGGENVTFRTITETVVREKNLSRLFVPVPPALTWISAAVLESAAVVTRRRPRISFVNHYGASRFYYYDSSKAKNELGYAPRNFKEIYDECFAFLEQRRN